MRILISALLLGVLFPSFSQDSLSRKLVPALYVDYGKAVGSLDVNALKLEGSAEVILLDKWQLVTEVGYWDLKPESAIENGSYQVWGNYARYGFGFLPWVSRDSRFGVGVRWANATYTDNVSYTISSDLQPADVENFKRIDQSANWYELVAYSDKKMNKWLTAGFNFRLRFGLTYEEQTPIDVVTIPGYGRAQDKMVPALNLFVKIPF